MINSVEFAKRLQQIIDFYDESASSFAEKIGVQRSSISHILSGRNRPSLDFVMKVLHSYPELDLYWLMNGKGEFPNGDNFSSTTSSDSTKDTVKANKTTNTINPEHEIEKIVIFYKDGTFKSYTP